MQVQNKSLSLFDYIANSNNTNSGFENAIARQKSDVANEIRTLQTDIAADKIDDTLARLQSGEGNLSMQTLDNMLNFNLISVSQDLQQVAAELGINNEVSVNQLDGLWQIQGAADDKALQQLQNYLDRNKGLQTKLDTINQLSEMVELGKSQELAKQLQEANVSEPDVVNYLTQARDYLFSIDSFTLSSKKLTLGSQGEAENFFAQVKKVLGVSDKSQ